jgi:hypothetical protein
MPSKEAARIGARAEAAARRKYGLETDSTESHDLIHPSNGYVYSVKSTRTETNDGYPGRFRIWKKSHETFIQERGAYIFAVYAPDSGRIWTIQKVSQQRVDDLVSGRWYPSGHDDKGRQYKLPWREVLNG